MTSVGGAVAAVALLLMLLEITWVQAGGSPSTMGGPPPERLAVPNEKAPLPSEAIRPTADRMATVCQYDPEQGPEMVLLAGGAVQQGSPESEVGRTGDESPQHAVTIPQPFALGRCEVTVGEFRQFVEASGYTTDAETSRGCYVWNEQERVNKLDPARNWKSPGFAQTDQHPVTCVSWNDAQAYITWLNAWLGLRPNTAYRLPTESEWEYAARAGTTTPYFWSDASQCQYANGADQTAKHTGKWPANWTYAACADQFVFTAPVGSFSPNRWGLYDTSGNVGEWVADCWHESYKAAPADGSAWLEAGSGDCSRRVLRGGGWYGNPLNLRSANRNWNAPDGAYIISGFGLARTP